MVEAVTVMSSKVGQSLDSDRGVRGAHGVDVKGDSPQAWDIVIVLCERDKKGRLM